MSVPEKDMTQEGPGVTLLLFKVVLSKILHVKKCTAYIVGRYRLLHLHFHLLYSFRKEH